MGLKNTIPPDSRQNGRSHAADQRGDGAIVRRGDLRWDERVIPHADGTAETQVIHRVTGGSHPLVRATSIRGRRRRSAEPGREAGQSLVEFSLVLMPLFFILLGIIQFGFIFNTYITMANAARDAVRLGTVYDPVPVDAYGVAIYGLACTKDQNDVLRNEAIRKSLLDSMNGLSTTASRFTTTAATPTGNPCVWNSGFTASGTTFTNGDLVITYVVPSGITDTPSRTGQEVTVQAVYHQDLVVPLISNFLPKDSGGRLRLTGVVTMVIN
jgi:Flp pilus assembly protein TadG